MHVLLCSCVTFFCVIDRQREDLLISPTVLFLKLCLLLLEFKILFFFLLVLHLEWKLDQHSIFLLFVQGLDFCLLFGNR